MVERWWGVLPLDTGHDSVTMFQLGSQAAINHQDCGDPFHDALDLAPVLASGCPGGRNAPSVR